MTSEMKLRPNHWMVRWYRHYVALGGRERKPENLCRFIRVVLFWAPLRWCFSGKYHREEVVIHEGIEYHQRDRFDRTPPAGTAIIFLMLLAAFVLFVLPLIFKLPIFWAWLTENWLNVLAFMGGAVAIAAVIGLIYVLVKGTEYLGGIISDFYQNNIKVARWYREAKAGKLCPIIDFGDTTEKVSAD